MQFDEAVAESSREHLTSTVAAWRILCSKEHKVGVRFNNFLSFGYEKLAIVIEQSIESFENIRRRKIQFVQNDPVTFSNRLNQNAFLEYQFARLVGNIEAKILLNVSVLVIVDTNEFMTSAAGLR